jgi:ABC-2 type transport system ATP-binding protein
VPALQQLDLELRSGEIYGLVGCDGAGKTTTLRILAGLMVPDEGEVRVNGENPLQGKERLRRSLGYMPQHYSLYGDLTVEENLRFFSRMFCLSRSEYQQRRERLLQLTRLEPFVRRRADALSGGMYKKLALACTLLPRPKVLLLDEPTNGVDPVSRRELWALLFEFAAEGMAILLSTAYMDEADRCHCVGLIAQGKIRLEGAPAALLASFPHQVYELRGTSEQPKYLQLLREDPAVLSLFALGSELRVIFRQPQGQPSGLQRLAAHLAHEGGATLTPVPPSFEELFLCATRER